MAKDLTDEQAEALRFLNTTRMSFNPGSDPLRIPRVRRSKKLSNLEGVRVACCSRNHKRAALLFDFLSTATTLFERESPDYEELPAWVVGIDAECFAKAQDISFARAGRTWPHELDFATFQGIGRDATLVELARIYRAQGAEASVLDLAYPEVLEAGIVATPEIGLAAALSTIPVAVEKELTWSQVEEFRRDDESVRKYRDLHLWISHGLAAKTQQQAADVIAQKIEDYGWAIKKHGIVTKLEVISSILAAGTLVPSAGGAVAAAAQIDERIATIVGAALAVVGVSAWVAKRKVEMDDVKRGQNREIAYLYDIRNNLL